MGQDSEHRADVARSVQKSDRLFEPGRSLQATGSMAREARTRLECGDAADDAAGAAKDLSSRDERFLKWHGLALRRG